MLPSAAEYAVKKAAKEANPPNSFAELAEYLEDNGVSSRLIERNRKPIADLYLETRKLSFCGDEMPPSPPPERMSSESHHNSSRASHIISESVDGQDTPNENQYPAMISVYVDGVETVIGCKYSEDDQTLISETIVQRWKLQKVDGLVQLNWNKLKSRRTHLTMCRPVPADDLDSDVLFGKDRFQEQRKTDNITRERAYDDVVVQQSIAFKPYPVSDADSQFVTLGAKFFVQMYAERDVCSRPAPQSQALSEDFLNRVNDLRSDTG